MMKIIQTEKKEERKPIVFELYTKSLTNSNIIWLKYFNYKSIHIRFDNFRCRQLSPFRGLCFFFLHPNWFNILFYRLWLGWFRASCNNFEVHYFLMMKKEKCFENFKSDKQFFTWLTKMSSLIMIWHIINVEIIVNNSLEYTIRDLSFIYLTICRF